MARLEKRSPLAPLVVVGLSISCAGHAEDDLVNCRYTSTGLPIPPRICQAFREQDAQAAEKARAHAELEAVRDQAYWDQKYRDQQVADQRRAAEAAESARIDAENAARQREREDEARKEEARAVAEEKAAVERTRKLKAECGDDYGQIRVGMTIERVQQCTVKLTLQGQMNTAEGIVDIYQFRSGYSIKSVLSQGGFILSWY